MKKTIAIILSLCMLLALCPAMAFAEDTLKLTVVTDVHHAVAYINKTVTTSTPDNPFGYTESNGKLVYESAAIVDEFLARAAEDDSEYLLITGDISDTGAEADVAAITAKLEKFEQESGKTVLALEGNHEYQFNTMANDTFKEYYKNLGYDKALAIDPGSTSYTADLGSDYRLIAIDTNNFNQARFDWIEEQVLAAKADGRNIITMTHFSLFGHYQVQEIVHSSILDPQWNLPDKFIEWGIKFNFSGHTHELDTAAYKNENGTVYDITSGSLTTYPCNWKTAVFSDKNVKLDTKYIEKIDTSVLPDGIDSAALDLASTDFRAFAKKMFEAGTYKQIDTLANASYLIGVSGLNPTTDKELCDIITKVVPLLKDAILMPFDGDDGLRAYAKSVGITIPATDYADTLEAGVILYESHCAGGEDLPIYEPVCKVAMAGLAASLSYALKDVTAEEYEAVLNWAVNKFNLGDKINGNITSFAANAISRADGIEQIVVYALTPVIEDFTVDAAPDDIKATLPAYASAEEEQTTLFGFIDWLKRLVSKILSFFEILNIFSK